MSATDTAAWWGAIAGTLVLVWDIYKWRRSGPSLRVSASVSGTLVSVRVANAGTQPTTLTKVFFLGYRSSLARFLRKPSGLSEIDNLYFHDGFPRIIAPGEQWTTKVTLSHIEEDTGGEKILLCAINDSSRSRPNTTRVRIE